MNASTSQRRFALTLENRRGVAIGVVVASAFATTAFAPDLVSGSQHEHLPLPALLVWLWSMPAILYLRPSSNRTVPISAADAATIVSIWVLSAAAAVFGPVLVTGTDPTRVPLAALAAPIVATLATGDVCLRAALTHEQRSTERTDRASVPAAG